MQKHLGDWNKILPKAEKAKLEQRKIALEHARLESEREKEAHKRAIQEKQEKIAGLLKEANRALSASRLTSPAGDNAMEYFQSVLKLDNSNIPARKGIGQIVTRYLAMAESALKRVGQPEDLAYLVAFLASEKAAYITGQVIHVSGGMYM